VNSAPRGFSNHGFSQTGERPRAVDDYAGVTKGARHCGRVGNVNLHCIEVTTKFARQPLELRIVARRESRRASDSLELMSDQRSCEAGCAN
jgi:hypothetical protein